jgi:Cysteine rich repeat
MAQPANAVPPAAAAKARPLRANMRACRTDIATLCGAVEQGGGRKVKCLMDNQAKLSPDCAAAVTSVQSQKQASKSACESDIATLCPTARGPARRQCLDANTARLSPACADTLAARAAKQDKRATAPPKQ